jgi:hypothetical protein
VKALIAAAAFVAVGLTSCTAQQATNVTNAVFTADQAACLAVNSGLAGNSTAVQDLEAACAITTPQFDAAVQQFVIDLTTGAAAKRTKR